MSKLDKLTERFARRLAHKTSRRSLFTKLGAVMVGTAALPLLPVARAAAQHGASGGGGRTDTGSLQDPGDPSSCDYWRYCAIDGFLCECCGGSPNSCPAGTEMSPITWIGTCQNPADGRAYIISYNDCCGGPECARCFCNTNVSDRPMSRPQENNDINWCLGTASTAYTCSTAVIVGVALESAE